MERRDSKGNGGFFIKVALTVAILLMVFPTFLLLSGVPVSFGFLGFDGSLVAFATCVISLIVLIWKRDKGISLGRVPVFCPWRRVYGCELFGRHARAGTKSELVRRLGQIMR